MAPKKVAPKPKAKAKAAAKPAAKSAKPVAKPASKSKPKSAPQVSSAKPTGKGKYSKMTHDKKAEEKAKKFAPTLKKADEKKAATAAKDKRREQKKKRTIKESVLFVPRPKNFGIGQDIKFKSDMTRFVRWPLYVQRQRQKSVLLKRLKVPPAINQFRHTLDRITKKLLFKFARKYKPDGKIGRKQRLKKFAKRKAKNPKEPLPKSNPCLKYGLKRVTRLIERKLAKLVLIANDVEPLELVIWMPTLCKKLGVPYCIVKNKSALGKLTGFKKTTCCCFTTIKSEHKDMFEKLCESVKIKFNDKYEEHNRRWGGLTFSKKHTIKMAKRAKARAP